MGRGGGGGILQHAAVDSSSAETQTTIGKQRAAAVEAAGCIQHAVASKNDSWSQG